MKKIAIWALVLSAFGSALIIHKKEFPADREMDDFIGRLLGQMTVQEKIGQLNLITPRDGSFFCAVVAPEDEVEIVAGQVGGLTGVMGPGKVRKAQELAVNQSRMKIPLLFGFDVIHGYKTAFPIPLGLSCSWDMELIEKTARIAAVEATRPGRIVLGIFRPWWISPVIRAGGALRRVPVRILTWDPRLPRRWSGATRETNPSRPDTLLATVKHFALYGAAVAG